MQPTQTTCAHTCDAGDEATNAQREKQFAGRNRIQEGSYVRISVVMADMTGKVLEESGPEGILLRQGRGLLFPKLEAALMDRFEGEGFSISLEPEDAFGEYDADSIEVVPLSRFANPQAIEVNQVLEHVPGVPHDGRVWRVSDIAQEVAIVEPNHPLAGIGLQFAIQVLEVSDSPLKGQESEDDEQEGATTLVPSFLTLADKIVSEDDDDDIDYRLAQEASLEAYNDDSSMARLAKPARIVR